MKKLIISILLLCSVKVFAGNTYYEFGAGVQNETQQTYSDVKIGEIGRWHEGKTFTFHYGAGGWIDSSQYKGAESGYYLCSMLGFEPQMKSFYLNYSIGPAILYPTDTILGGNLQFAQELGFGAKDARGVRVGFAVRHFSDAGFVKPNIGRNFFVVRVQH